MSRPLRVYSYRGYRSECPAAPNGNRQTREVVAARSVAEAMRLFGIKRSEWAFSGSVTGNEFDVRAAMSKPGTVFWQPIDWRGPADLWNEAKGESK